MIIRNIRGWPTMKNILILGAAGRDFHNFNVVFRDHPEYRVVGFTATQIPGIADRRYPAQLAGPSYPEGISIYSEHDLEELIGDLRVDAVVFSYSDISHVNLMHLASRIVAAGVDFWLLGSRQTQLKAAVPVISVCAVRTGCGKSPVSRRVASELRRNGLTPVVVRHPMPYGDLASESVQRYATMDDLDVQHCTIEEREEYEPHLREGTVVYAGVDYEKILRQAEKEADIVLWDGGNNDTPFYTSDLEIVVADPHRAGHELLYFPGEVNLRHADVVVINKVNTASDLAVKTVRDNVRNHNPKAKTIEAASRVSVTTPEIIARKRVLVVEDGPTLTHGEMSYGAGVVAARQFGAAELVDPRPYAVGSIRSTFERFPQITNLLPAMGYSEMQRHELEETIQHVPCDLVLVATPIDLARVIKLSHPYLHVSYEVEELTRPGLAEIIGEFAGKHASVKV
jgi:predicted GTPase